VPLPLHRRMRAFDRDLIGGRHYGQRSCEPHLTGRTHGCTDHACHVKKSLLIRSRPHMALGGHPGRVYGCPALEDEAFTDPDL